MLIHKGLIFAPLALGLMLCSFVTVFAQDPEANPPIPESPALPARVVSYVAMVASLIEGRRVSREEIVRMWLRAIKKRAEATT